MESREQTKARLRAVKNVGQITKAMEVVAATKMRRAQETAINSRPYAFEALHLLEKIDKNTNEKLDLTEPRKIKKTLLVIVASDKGLAGSFNAQVFRVADKFLANKNIDEFTALTVGKKSTAYAQKNNLEIAESFSEAGDFIKPEEVEPITNHIINGFKSGKWDQVITISTHFRTALKQETMTRQILPVDFQKIRETVKEIVPEHGRYADIVQYSNDNSNGETEYILEPSPREALDLLVNHLVKMQIYHLILEANASEHSARRVAMKTACDNADELGNELTLTYNKARQASITKELIEITSTQNALN